MLPGTFPSVRPAKCGSLPTPSQQHVRRRPQRQASITYSDEEPQVKTENRETAAPFARARVRACQSVSVFCLHLFTHMPQNSDSQINRGEGFAQKPPHFAYFSGLFLRQSAVIQNIAPLHHKKAKFDQCLRPPKPLCGVLFSSKGSVGAATHKPFIPGGLRNTFSAGRYSSRHGSRLEFTPRNGVKQSSRYFLTGGCESVNPNRQSIHTYQTMGQHFASYG